MLQGWPLAAVTILAIAVTLAVGRTHPLAWALLGGLLMLLGLYALGAMALFIGAAMLVYRISSMPD